MFFHSGSPVLQCRVFINLCWSGLFSLDIKVVWHIWKGQSGFHGVILSLTTVIFHAGYQMCLWLLALHVRQCYIIHVCT